MASDKIAQLIETRAGAHSEMQKMLERGQDTWTADDEKRWDELDSTFEGAEDKIRQLQRQAEREARFQELEERRERQKSTDRSTVGEMRANREARVQGLTEGEMQGLCFRAWLRPSMADQRTIWACAERNFPYQQSEVSLRAFEPSDTTGLGRRAQLPEMPGGVGAHVHRVWETRALSKGTTTAGGHTVPDGIMQALEISMLEFGGMRRVASVTRAGDGRQIPWPSVNDTANKGEIIGENSAANTQDVTFGQVTTTPFLYSSKYVPVSIQLIQDSNESIEGLLGRLLGERLGRIQNDHFTEGAGTTEPRGINLDTNSAVTLATDDNPTYSELINLKHGVDPAYRSNGMWMFNDTVLKNIKLLLDGNNLPIWKMGNIVSGEPNAIDGDPYLINQSITTGGTEESIFYGDLSKYKIHDALDMQFRRLDELHALNHQVTFLAFMRSDGRLLDAGTDPVKSATNAA